MSHFLATTMSSGYLHAAGGGSLYGDGLCPAAPGVGQPAARYYSPMLD